VGVINSTIEGLGYVGGIAGYNAGTISNCYSTAKVEGENYIGGFVGKNDGSIRSSYSVGEVKGRTNAGEFVGFNCETCKIIGGYTVEDMKNNAEFTDELNKVAALFSTTISPMKKWVIDEANDGYPVLSNENTEYNLASYFESGNGRQASPYVISTANQLEYLSLLVELKELTFKDNFFKLGNNIPLSKAKGWTPIGTSKTKPFAGTFDGNGKTISGIYINSNGDNIGLFGYVSGDGKLKNIIITDSDVKGRTYVGGLVGYNAGDIDSCSFSGTVTGTYHAIGGLAGLLTDKDETGVKNSYSTGAVKGIGNSVNIGGLVGGVEHGMIEKSYSTSTVTAEEGLYVGGLAGAIGFNATVSKNYSTGTVTGKSDVGGLLGTEVLNIEQGEIENNYSTGAVSGDSVVGGLIGSAQGKTNINNSYSIGVVNGKKNSGGLIGAYWLSTIRNSYYDKTINNTIETSEGKTTEDLKKQQTYVGWDFDDIWRIDEEKKIVNKGYPYFVWNEENLRNEALSSSSVIVSSSSSNIIPSSSSVSSSSGAARPPQVIASCDGFVEGTTRVHFGESKRQFCDKRDGKKYVYVTIGDQDWMAENLRYDYDQCGKPLGRCYGDDPANCEKYGMLYTIAEAEPDGWKINEKNQTIVENLCPEGWHIPSHAELSAMIKTVDPNNYLGEGDSLTGAGKNQSSIGLKTIYEWDKWGSTDGGGSDKYGFSALPGGYCGSGCPDNKPVWTGIGKISYWWTTSTGAPAPLSYTWNISYSSKSVADAMQSYPYSRFYARCMRNSNEKNNTEVAVATSTSSDSKCAASKPDYSGFGDAVKEAYPDLNIDMGGLETIDKTPSSSSNGNVTPPITTSILPQLALSNISAHLINKTIELQNLPNGAKVEIYNLQGKHIFTSGESLNRANRGSDNLRIQVHIGMYIIKVSLGSEVKILRVPVM